MGLFAPRGAARRQQRHWRGRSLARRRPWWQALDLAPAIEALEDRTLLSGPTDPEPVKVVLLSDLETIEVVGAGQFGSNPGVLVDFERRFALTFDTGTKTIGGFVNIPLLGEWGAELKARLHGILGFDVGFFIDTGSVNAAGQAQVRQEFEDPIAAAQVTVTTELLSSLTEAATFSPQFGAFVELVTGIGGSVNLSAAAGGDRISVGTPNGFGGTLETELLAFNRDHDGQLRTLGEEVTTDDLNEIELKVEVSKPAHPVKVEVGAKIQPQLDPLGLSETFFVTANPRNNPHARVTVDAGTASQTVPVINLEGSTTQASGVVKASGSADIADVKINVPALAAAILPVPSPVGVGTTEIKVGPASLTLTPLDFFAGPELSVSQTWEAQPTGRMTYHFDRPVAVSVDGVNFPELQTVTFDVGQDVHIQFRSEPILVQPEWTYALEFTNQIDLVLDLVGHLKILAAELDIDLPGFARSALRDLFGISLPLTVGPLLERDFKFDSRSFDVFNETFNLVEQTFALPSFVIGGNADPDLEVTSLDENGKSLRAATIFSNENPALDANGNPAPDGEANVIILDQGTYSLTTGSGHPDDAFGDLDVTAGHLRIVGAGPGLTIIDAGNLAVLDRVLEVHPGAKLTLEGVTIRGGDAAGNFGGGILNRGELILNNVEIVSNSAFLGGGLANRGDGHATLNNVTIRDNTAVAAPGTGGPLGLESGFGGGIYVEGGTLNAEAIIVTSNHSGQLGGGISNHATTNLTASTISGNTASHGGGIFNASSGTMSLARSTVSGNTAQGYDGFLPRLLVTGSRGTGEVTNGGGGGGAAGLGGGVFNAGLLTIESSTVSGNQALGGDGARGGVFGSNFTQSQGGRGGQPQGGSSGGGTNLHGGQAFPPGSGLFGHGGGGAAGDVSTIFLGFPNNIVPSHQDGGTGGFGGGGGGAGGTFFGANSGGSGGFGAGDGGDSAAFNLNGGFGAGGGGGAGLGGGIFNRSGATLTVTHSTIANNDVVGGAGGSGAGSSGKDGENGLGIGGGLFSQDGASTSIGHTIVADNSSPDVSGAVASLGHNLIENPSGVTGTILSDPSNILNQDPRLAPLGDNGGPTKTHRPLAGSPALAAGSAPPDVDQRGIPSSLIEAVNIGSVQFLRAVVEVAPDPQPGILTLRDAMLFSFGFGDSIQHTFQLQEGVYSLADGDVTAEQLEQSRGNIGLFASDLRLEGAGTGQTVIDARGTGQRVFFVDPASSLSLADLTVTGGSTTSAQGGAGILNLGTLALENVAVIDNVATTRGGGISNEGSATLLGSVISDNSAAWGGGIYNEDTLAIITSTIARNAAVGRSGHNAPRNGGGGGGGGGAGLGGGLYNAGGSVTVTASTLSTNRAEGGRGGSGLFFRQFGVFPVSAGGAGSSGDTALGQSGAFSTVRPDVPQGFVAVQAKNGAFGNGGGGGAVRFSPIPDTQPVDEGADGGFGAGGGGGGGITDHDLDAPGGNGGFAAADGHPGFQAQHQFFGTVPFGGSGGGGAGIGGAVFNSAGTISFQNSTLTSNSARGGGGGALESLDGVHQADGGQGVAGGIFVLTGTVELASTIVAANTADRDPDLGEDDDPGTTATFTSAGHNLIGDGAGVGFGTATDLVGTPDDRINPALHPLADNGGPTPTHLPRAESPALDAGAAFGLVTDQRGLPRADGVPDIGAVEVQRNLVIELPEGAHARLTIAGKSNTRVESLGGLFESFSFGNPLETLTIRETGSPDSNLPSIWEIGPLGGAFTISLETVGDGDRIELTDGADLNTPGGVTVGRLDTLAGDGSVSEGLTVAAEGRVEPAAGRELLVTGNVLLEPQAVFVATLGVFVITLTDEEDAEEVEQVEAGTLAVRGETSTIELEGAVLELNLPPAFDPDPNTVVTLIQNETFTVVTLIENETLIEIETISPITGIFDGLPEGAEFTVDGVNFRITYVGGPLGHDVELIVNPQNVPPRFLKGPDQLIQQPAGPQSVEWLAGVVHGPGNERSETVTFIVTADDPSLFSQQPAISSEGLLTYTPAAIVSGTTTVTVIARDDGGTANGGNDTSDPQTFRITVVPGFQRLTSAVAPVDVDLEPLIAHLLGGERDPIFAAGDAVHGSVEVLNRGSVARFTPDGSGDSPASFTFTVTNRPDRDEPQLDLGPFRVDVFIDAAAPISRVDPLPVRADSLTFPVSVTADDPLTADGLAAGVATIDVFVSVDGAAFTLWQTLPADSPSAVFTAESNHSYGFRSIARDALGNVETKPVAVEAGIFVPDLEPPETAVHTVDETASTLSIHVSGSDPGGSGLHVVDVFVQIDGADAWRIGRLAAGPVDADGVHHNTLVYQALADGSEHTYRFYTEGVDRAGNREAAPADPADDVVLTTTFAAAAALAVTHFDVQQGANQRSFIRHLDISFNRNVAGELQTIVDTLTDADPANDRLSLTRFDLSGMNGIDVSAGLADASIQVFGQMIRIDFGPNGIGGNRNSNVGNGYYQLSFDLDGAVGELETHLNFYRLFGDTNGDRVVDTLDLLDITDAFGQAGENLDEDVNGDGVVNSLDRFFASREVGKLLDGDLLLDD